MRLTACCAPARELVMTQEVICSTRLLQWAIEDMHAEHAAFAAARIPRRAILAGNAAWRQALSSKAS